MRDDVPVEKPVIISPLPSLMLSIRLHRRMHLDQDMIIPTGEGNPVRHNSPTIVQASTDQIDQLSSNDISWKKGPTDRRLSVCVCDDFQLTRS